MLSPLPPVCVEAAVPVPFNRFYLRDHWNAAVDRAGLKGVRLRRSAGSNPSLMIGLAGVGYFFLGLADPALPSVLLVTPPARPT